MREMIHVPFGKWNSFNTLGKYIKFGTDWVDSLLNTLWALDIENPPRLAIRKKMVTRGIDLWCVARGLPGAKHHKSIPRVTIFLLIASHGELYVSHVIKTIKHTTH